ncbi:MULTISPECIES: magnesium-dependent phosphatase-1 [Metallosphaera]|uniref:Magnesium-dependent phosphatase-1 n=3 Tax=Metallosphaera TaxID=41980 RepID=A4YI18_METS5|nr:MULTISPECIES: magnesium-dependent phosphatase-1 [Metallosphaera]ABP96070.1 magnesium-dependent phosphatase-1 [Metallosphaera sedula DSM 5348]AIM28054.1 magnesium-dependent phosphatase-1 [Metallosphaera sedula]AKV74887.1 phosphatase [Metallosphaera sedula]AKV77124.1 phosphatase [Metallosphaera sedula]AKV79375.1 phosphatase [Metallosphaera sedula]
MIKLVIFDADKTLWDHYNISEFEEPFHLPERDILRDSEGRTLKLFPNVRKTLEELKRKDVKIAMATWNFPHKTEKVLKALELDSYFDVVVSRDFPFKFIMIAEILRKFAESGIRFRPEEILFVDDRRAHFGNVWLYLGRIQCLEMWKDINDHLEIISKLENSQT